MHCITFGVYLAAIFAESCDCWHLTAFGVPLQVWIYTHGLFRVFHMTARFKFKVFLPLDWLLSWAVELHLLEVAGYETPVFHLRSFCSLEMDLIVSGYFDIHITKAFYRPWKLVCIITPCYANLWYIVYVYKHLYILCDLEPQKSSDFECDKLQLAGKII